MRWSKPVNLGEGIGEDINTRFDEIDPFIRRPIDVPGNTGESLHPAGLYFIHLSSNESKQTRKAIYVK